MKKFVPSDAILVPDNAEKLFSGVIFDVYQWQQQMFNDTKETFEMLKRKDTVTVICVVDDQILILDEEQPNAGLRQGFPGGRVDDEDSDVTETARREVLEETGYLFKNYKLVKVDQPYAKIEWFVYTLIAWDVDSVTEPKPDAGEKISLSTKSFAEVLKLAKSDSVHLAECLELLTSVSSTSELINLKSYSGALVDR